MFSGCTFFSVQCSLDDAFAALPTTSERLGAAAAYTTVHAGDKRSFSHCLFCGVTARRCAKPPVGCNAAKASSREYCTEKKVQPENIADKKNFEKFYPFVCNSKILRNFAAK